VANGSDGQNGGVFGRIPTTQIIEKRTDSTRSAVKDPVAQARHLALGWATLVLSIILAILSFGQAIFWLAAFVVGVSTFLWFLLQAARTEYIIEGKGTRVGIAPSEALAGFLVSALVGGVAWSLWMVVSTVAIDIPLPDWAATWLPNLAALGSLLGVVFSAAYIIHLEPAFLQELMYRSPAIEQGLGNLISQTDPPWHAGRIQKPARPLPSTPRPIPQSGVPTARAAPPERATDYNERPIATAASNGVFEAPSGIIRTRPDLAEFVQSVGSGVKAPQLKVWESKGRGRDHNWWCDMVDVSAMFGLVSPRKGGAKVRVLRQDWLTILREIEQSLD